MSLLFARPNRATRRAMQARQEAAVRNRLPLTRLVGLPLLLLLTFALRVLFLDLVPPGWRDDELINSLVISQKALAGDWSVYYADASGHEALYHWLNAVMLGLFGPGVWGIRYLSSLLGTLTVALTFAVGRRLFGTRVAWIAALALALSFWSLMYSRIGLRHIALPVTALATFFWFWQGLKAPPGRWRPFAWAGLWLGVGFYTYFASRGVPLILGAFVGLGWLFERPLFRARWKPIALTFGLALLLALPLLITLRAQPEAESRVAELAVPIIAAQEGDFAPLVDFTLHTLGMFHATGDDESLYNLPGRPVFGPSGAIFFWVGVVLAGVHTLRGLLRREKGEGWLAQMFLLGWWLTGISPGFISVPPSSYGHTILAQPATYLLAALPVVWLIERFDNGRTMPQNGIPPLTLLFCGLFLLPLAIRDVNAYFVTWPAREQVRFLYRADFHDVARSARTQPELSRFGVASRLAGPWDREALQVDLDAQRQQPVLVDPSRALLLTPDVVFTPDPATSGAICPTAYRPEGETAGSYHQYAVSGDPTCLQTGEALLVEAVCYDNGLCVEGLRYDPASGRLYAIFGVQAQPEQERPLISNPPPPGVYAGPRLLAFAQLLDVDGVFLTGDDALGVDGTTLRAGDRFVQRHTLIPPPESVPSTLLFGLYDPLTGARLRHDGGGDDLRFELE